MGWDNDYLHYTNVDNPFGDNDLLSTFRWDKKLEKEGLKGVSQEEVAMMNKIKMEENKRELEKVRFCLLGIKIVIIKTAKILELFDVKMYHVHFLMNSDF